MPETTPVPFPVWTPEEREALFEEYQSGYPETWYDPLPY